MDNLELLKSTFKGENDERVLYSYWKHFPYDDRDAERLAEAHIKYYERHKFDLMKISSHGRYPVVDWGCEVSDEIDPISGSTRCKNCKIEEIQDWETVEPVDVNEGEFGEQLKALQLIHKNLEALPKMMTIFSPLMVASKLDCVLEESIKINPKLVKESLYVITDVMTEFAEASIDEGASGLFIASQHFRETSLSWKEVEQFEIFFLDRMLQKLAKKAEFTVFHIHGEKIFFNKTAKWAKFDALNWHDKTAGPPIEQAANIYPRGLLAGIDEKGVLREGDNHQIIQSVEETLKAVDGVNNRVVISPGCVIPIDVTDEKLDSITKTINQFNKVKK